MLLGIGAFYLCGDLLVSKQEGIWGCDMCTCVQIEAVDGDSPRPRLFHVAVKWAANINISALLDFVQGRGGDEILQDAVQVRSCFSSTSLFGQNASIHASQVDRSGA